MSGFQPSVRSDVKVIDHSVVEVDFVLKIREQRFVDPVWTFIEPFVGGDAVACGTHQRLAAVAALNRSLECGLQAVRDVHTFWTVREWPGIDSNLAHGLLGRRDGRIFVFDYDSAPYRGLLVCADLHHSALSVAGGHRWWCGGEVHLQHWGLGPAAWGLFAQHRERIDTRRSP